MMAVTRAVRLADMVTRLRAGEQFSAKGAALEYEVTPRTIQRDMLDIDMYILPLVWEHRRWRKAVLRV